MLSVSVSADSAWDCRLLNNGVYGKLILREPPAESSAPALYGHDIRGILSTIAVHCRVLRHPVNRMTRSVLIGNQVVIDLMICSIRGELMDIRRVDDVLRSAQRQPKGLPAGCAKICDFCCFDIRYVMLAGLH